MPAMTAKRQDMTARRPRNAPEDLILVRTAADRIGIDITTAYRWVHAGEMPGIVQQGQRWWVRSQELEDWLAGSREQPVGVEHPLDTEPVTQTDADLRHAEWQRKLGRTH
jgi:excisionase family DNA binding protein